ncbi:MAG: HEAT repeat domain-containing protein [Deltaproteobacteria bacterium]
MRTEELAPAISLTAHSLCVVGAFVVGRSARDALFLGLAPRDWLPWMYLASAVAVALCGWAYGRLADRWRRDTMAFGTAALLGLALLIAYAFVRARIGGLATVLALYVIVEIAGALTVMQLWTLANDAYNPREARRIFPVIVAGGIFANIACGFGASALARGFGTDSLLLLSGLLLWGAAALSLLEGRLLALPFSGRRFHGSPVGSEAREPPALRDPHLRSVAKLLAMTFLTTTIVDYQFKLSAGAAYHGSALASFFGSYYAVTGILALGVQLFATRPLLDRLGLLAALAVLPLGLALGTGAFLATGSLWAAAMAQGSNVTFRYTINDSSVQLLYLPLPARLRGRAKAWIEGIGKPAAIATAATFLLVYQRLGGTVRPLGWLAMALVAGWLWLLVRARGSYVSTLERMLRRRELDPAAARLGGEGDAAAVLRRALGSADSTEVAHALELLPFVDVGGVDDELVGLLRHPSPIVRRLAVQQIAARRGLHHGNLIYQLFEDPEPAVRAEAIRAFCGMAREKAVRSVRGFLAAGEVEVRAAAVVGLVRHGGLDGILTAGPALKELLRGPSPLERRFGARALGDIGVRTFYQPLLELLGDPDVEVRRSALQAAGALRSPELVPALVYRLGEPAIAADAADALAAIGSAALERPDGPSDSGRGRPGENRRRAEPTTFGPTRLEETLEKVLRNPLEEPRVRANVPRVLARLGTPEAARVLGAALELSDEAIRSEVAHAFARLRRGHPNVPVDGALLGRALDAEIALVQETVASMRGLGLRAASPQAATARPESPEGARALLAVALEEQRARALDRVVVLVGLLHPRLGGQRLGRELVQAERAGSQGAPRRAAALELLDNVLPRALRGRVVSLWERPTTEGDGGTPGDGEAPGEGPDDAAWLGRLATDGSPWVQACALACLAHVGDSAQAPIAERALRSDQPRLREAALLCLARLSALPPRGALEPFLQDPDAGVRAAAELALEQPLATVVPLPRRSARG